MGENFGKKARVSLSSSDDVHFQSYVESAVKQRQIPLNLFEKLLEDFMYLDIDRLKYLNTILLNELTKNYSEIDRSRYLTSILLTKFKEESEKSTVDLDLNNEILQLCCNHH